MARVMRLAAAALLLCTVAAHADMTVTPSRSPVVEQGGSVTTGGTFQTLLTADSSRTGCLIQNTSAETEYVYFGATANATTANSFQLASKATISCNSGAAVAVTNNIAITGTTTGDTFVFSYEQ